MADLIIKEKPLIEGLPHEVDAVILRDAQPEAITAISLLGGDLAPVIDALGAWPQPGQSLECSAGRLLWTGLDQAMLFGRAQIAGAACVDLSSGWVFLALEGAKASDVMARLVPLDLRASHVEIGQCFRSQLGHLVVIIHVTKKGFELGVMSSFAQTAKHEIITAMELVAARNSSIR